MKYPVKEFQPQNFNFNKDRIVGLKLFSQGAGSNQFTMTGGKLWGGAAAYSSGILKIDLSAKTLAITGTINAVAGIFSGDITVSGSLTGGIIRTSSATNVERIILDSSASNNRMFQIWNSSNAVRAWIGKGEGSASDLAINTVASLDFSFAASLGYDRYCFMNTSGIKVDSSHNEAMSIGDTTNRFNEIWAKKIGARTKFACGDGAGEDGKSGNFGYTDDNGNHKTFRFEGGILVQQS